MKRDYSIAFVFGVMLVGFVLACCLAIATGGM